jgi:hypothetical protein
VRVTVEGIYSATFPDDGPYITVGEAWVRAERNAFEVEVLERADDPTQDPVWTVRTVEPKPPMASTNTVVKFADEYWLYAIDGAVNGNGYGRLDWSQVRSSTVIGAVPGTAAARFEDAIDDLVTDAQARLSVRVVNEPHGPSPEARQRIAGFVQAGEIPTAVKAVIDATHWQIDDAHQYVRDMSEYKEYLKSFEVES